MDTGQGTNHQIIGVPLIHWPVCAAQMQNYEKDQDWFEARATHVLAVSVDAVPSKAAWAKSLGGISYDLLSDFHPHGAVAEAYGVIRDGGISGAGDLRRRQGGKDRLREGP